MTARGTCPVITTRGDRVHVGRRDARDRVRGARPACDEHHAGSAGSACVPVGHMHRALLMPGEDVGDPLGVVKRVVDADGLTARIAEHHVDALRLERRHDGLGAEHDLALLGRARTRALRRADASRVAPVR